VVLVITKTIFATSAWERRQKRYVRS